MKRYYVFSCVCPLVAWPILLTACVSEEATVSLHGTLEIEDSASRTLAIEFASNSRWACVLRDATVVNGELAEARIYGTGETIHDFAIGTIGAAHFNDASYNVRIIEDGKTVNLAMIPSKCRGKAGPVAHREVVVAVLSIPRQLEAARVLYPCKQGQTETAEKGHVP